MNYKKMIKQEVNDFLKRLKVIENMMNEDITLTKKNKIKIKLVNMDTNSPNLIITET